MSTKSGTYTRTARQTDGRTDGQTDKAKTICPADFSQAGHKKLVILRKEKFSFIAQNI